MLNAILAVPFEARLGQARQAPPGRPRGHVSFAFRLIHGRVAPPGEVRQLRVACGSHTQWASLLYHGACGASNRPADGRRETVQSAEIANRHRNVRRSGREITLRHRRHPPIDPAPSRLCLMASARPRQPRAPATAVDPPAGNFGGIKEPRADDAEADRDRLLSACGKGRQGSGGGSSADVDLLFDGPTEDQVDGRPSSSTSGSPGGERHRRGVQ